MTRRLAEAASRHPWRTIGAWGLALVVSFAAIALLLGGALTSESDVTNNPESKQANALLAERWDRGLEPTDVIVVRSPTATVDDPGFRAKVASVVRAARAADRRVFFTRGYYETRSPALVSHDRHALLVPFDPGTDEVEPLVDAVQREDGGAFDVTITGGTIADHDLDVLAQEDLRKGELLFGAPAALVILILVFGAVVAGLVPLLLAIVSIFVALALTAIVGQAFELSFFVVNMLTGMGLALGIDYSLFILSRYREERAAGEDKLDAIAAAGATASRAVLFSGMAFVLAMIGMVLVPDTILRSLATGAILVGIVSVVAALTLTPALLSLLGDRVNALRVPIFGRNLGRAATAEGRFWGAIVRWVMRRPVVSLVVAAGLLLAAAAPVLSINTGFAGESTLPNRFPSKQGYLALNQSFPGQTTDPVLVVVAGDVHSPNIRAGVDRLERALASVRGLATPRVGENKAGNLTVLETPVAGDPDGAVATSAVRKLRSDVIPRAFAGVDARVLVTGTTAEDVDYFDLVNHWLPLVFVFVLGLSFIVLTIAFRSIVLPLKAILLNLLSVGAAYGLLVLVFQKGVGAGLLGFQQVDTIVAWVPLFLFSVLFGLSMDYQVFLLSRIRERYSATGDNTGAVASGVSSTARLITGAALIIVAVFSGFAQGDLVMFQQMGFGIAVALLIDATIIRSVLVPASMKLLGRWNWYLPSWLSWIPDLQVEGAERRPRPGYAVE